LQEEEYLLVAKILIVDDHPIVRQGLKQIIDEAPDMAMLAEAASGEEALELVSKESFSIVILDLAMPGMSGIDAIARLKSLKLELPILVLSMKPVEQYGLRVLKAGASGYLNKESAPEELLVAIRRIIKGGKYIDQALSEQLALKLYEKSETPHELLSNREYEVFLALAMGKPIKQIAREMSLAVNTVSTYRSRILEKMQAQNDADLIRYALENQLID
jgi:two-component system invasion response regulator UvrY